MKLQNTFFNHLAALHSQFILILLMWISYEVFDFPRAYLTIFIIAFFVYAIPAYFLHLEYYYYNKNEIYEIDSDSITKYKPGKQQAFSVNDLEKIVLYKSANMDAWGFPLLGIEYYYYARIITNSGEELIITRLLTPKVEKAVRQLEGIPVERVKRAFCPIFWK